MNIASVIRSTVQFIVYSVLVFGTYYFGGVTVLGSTYMQVALGLALLCVSIRALCVSGDQCRLDCGGRSGMFLLLWIVALGCSAARSVYAPESVSYGLVVVGYAIMYMIIGNVFDAKQVRSLGLIIVLLAFAIALFGLSTCFLKNQYVFMIKKHFYPHRLTATFVNPNHCAAFFAMSLPLIFYYCRMFRKKRRSLCIAGFVCVLTAFLLTSSMSAWLAFGIALYFFYFLHRQFIQVDKTKLDVIFSVVLLVTAVIVTFFAFQYGFSKYFAGSKHYSIWQRIGIYKGSLHLLVSGTVPYGENILRILFGGGLNCFRYLFHGFGVQNDVCEFYHAHNEYLELLIEAGIVGCAAFVLFVTSVFLHGISFLKKSVDKDAKVFIVCGMTSFVFFLIHCMLEFNLRVFSVGLMFFAIAGMMSVVMRPQEQRMPLSRRFHLFVTVVLLCLSIIYMGCAARELMRSNLLDQARDYAIAHDFDNAEGCFALAGRIAPYNAEVDEAYGEYFMYRYFLDPEMAKKYLEKAEHHYKMMLVKNPLLPNCYLRLGWMYASVGDREQAQSFFNAAVRLNPRNLLSYLERGRFYLHNKEYALARDEFAWLIGELMKIPRSRGNRVHPLMLDIQEGFAPYKDEPEFQQMYAEITQFLNDYFIEYIELYHR